MHNARVNLYPKYIMRGVQCLFLMVFIACNGSNYTPVKGKTSPGQSAVKAAGKVQVPLEINLSIQENDPRPGDPITVILEAATRIDINEVVIKVASEGEIELLGETQFNVSDLSENTIKRLTIPARITGGGRGIIRGELQGNTVQYNRTYGKRASLYLLIDPAKTFISRSSFIQTQLERLNHSRQIGKISSSEYDRAYEEIVTGKAQTTITADPEDRDKKKRNDGSYNEREPRAAGDTVVVVSGKVLWSDRNGSGHPVRFAPVEIWDMNAGSDSLLQSVTSSDSGTFSATLINKPSDSVDVFLKIYARSDGFYILPDGVASPGPDKSYRVMSDTAFNLISNHTFNVKIDTSDNPGNAFSIHDAMVMGGLYVKNTAGALPAEIKVEFPTVDATSNYDGDLNILKGDRYDWDVIHHEYGHYIASVYRLEDNPGGNHALGEHLAERLGKGPGIRLAWGEGWPTYFALSLQIKRNGAATGIPFVGDSEYRDTEDATFSYDIETNDNLGWGEDNELACQRILWDLYDTNKDARDDVALGDKVIWDALARSRPVHLSGAWNGLKSRKTITELVKYGAIFADHHVAPEPTEPPENSKYTISDSLPTFKWKPYGAGPSFRNNNFTIKFYNADFSSLRFSKSLTDSSFTPTRAEFETILGAGGKVKWIVEGRNSAAPSTGVYISADRTIEGEPRVDVAFIIDDTGSMSEEIDGVRQALLNHLSTYSDTSGVVFQLASFKDNVTVRKLTTDLAVIQSQVSGLVASGGSDCPEASVEAIREVKDGVRNDGRVFLATDADPHPGQDINTLINDLRARGIRVDVILSGACGGTFAASECGPCRSDNIPQLKTESDESGSAGKPFEIDANSISAFEPLARETGGIFAYIPEVNSGLKNDSTRFGNSIFNIIQGGITQSIATANPSKGPIGGKMTLKIVGAETNFQSTTKLSFITRIDSNTTVIDSNITVTALKVLSPIQLEAAVSIDTSATIGFKDIIAITSLGAGVVDTARGIGVLEITDVPSVPTILGVQPSSGEVGEKLNVVIQGMNTHFTDSSIVQIGNGTEVAVMEVKALSDQELQVKISIDTLATIGFHDVSVRSGSELAAEGVTGPFFIGAPAPAKPELISMTPNFGVPGTRSSVTIEGKNTHFADGKTTVGFSGTGIKVASVSVNDTNTVRAQIEIASDAAPGFRDVRVTTDTEVAVLLSGYLITLVKPDLVLEKNSIDFGSVGLNDSLMQTLYISNRDTAKAALNIDSLKISGSDTSHFALLNDTTTFSLAPGDSKLIKIQFKPTAMKDLRATLQIVSNDPVNSNVQVKLLGKGTFNITASVLQNPAATRYADIVVLTDAGLKNTPEVKVNINGDTTLFSLDLSPIKGSQKAYKGAYEFSQNGTYVIRTRIAESGFDTTYVRNFGVQRVKPAVDAVVYTENKNSWLNIAANTLREEIYFVASIEQVDQEEIYTYGPPLKFDPPLALEMKFDPAAYPDPGKLFVMHRQGREWTILESQVFIQERKIRTFTGQLGDFKIAYLESFSGSNVVPEVYSLKQNYPNPFNPSTTIEYALPRDGMIQFDIYNMLGQKVKTLYNGFQRAGNHRFIWNALDEGGNRVASGVYFYRLQAESFKQTRKMLILK